MSLKIPKFVNQSFNFSIFRQMVFFDFFKSKNVSVTVNGNTNTYNQEDLNLDQEALTAYDNKNYKLSITLYSRLIERKPSAHQYYQFRGTVYEDMGDDDLAKSDFEKSIKLNPQNATSLFRLGMLYARRKDLQKAVTFLKEAYKYQPSDYKSYMGNLYNNILYVHKRVVAYNLGNYLTQIGQIAEGLKYLNEVISNCPEYSYPYFSISLVYFQKNNFQNALEYALKAQKYGHPKGLDLVNAIKMQMGNTVKDKYSTMVENSNFNPFNITTDERLQGGQPLPNLLDVFKRELKSSLNNTVLLSNLGAKQIVQSYVFNLAESYYNNAGYIPKVILDQIIEQVYKALLQIDTKAFTSLDELKYAVYYSLLNN